MDPSDPNRPNYQPTEAWFDTLPTPNVPKSASAPNPSHIGKRIVIIVVALLITSLTAIAVYVLLHPAAPPCLTADDYELLTGQAADPQMSVTENFYTTSLNYKNKTDQYTDDSKAYNQARIKVIGQLYANRSENSSMIVTLSGEYSSNDTASAASERIANLKKALIQSGVEESAIKTDKPAAIIDYGEISADSEELSVAKVYITITSDAACRS